MKKLIKYEMYKIFIRRFGLLFFLLFILLEVALSLGMSENVNPTVEDNKRVFLEYEVYLSGRVSDEKEDFLNAEYERINNAPIELENLTNKLRQGEISNDEFSVQVASLDELMSRRNGFNVVFNQYFSIRNQPENRYFLYDSGWNALLTKNDFNPALIFVLILLCIPLFCSEYESEIERILLTTRLGREKLACLKLALGIAISVFVAIAGSVVEYIIALQKYGLPNGNYPIQSLNFFSTSTWDISLFEGFIYLSLFRILGSVFITVFILMLSTTTKRTISVLFISSGVVLLPVFAPIELSLLYRLPLPSNLLTAFGYIRGDEIVGEDVIFWHLTTGEITMLMITFFVLMLAFAYVMMRKYLGRKLIKRPFKMALLSVLMLLSFTSCHASNDSEQAGEEQVGMNYNMAVDSRYAFYNGELFSFEVTDGSLQLLRTNIETSEQNRVILNPFMNNQNSHIISIFQDGSALYVSYSFNGVIYVSLIDLANYSEKVLLQYSFEQSYTLLQHNQMNDFHQYTLLMSSNIFAAENEIYFLHEGAIYRINRFTKRLEIIAYDCRGNIAFDGQSIYFINNRLQIEELNIATLKRNILPDIRADYFFLFNGNIYFSNLNAIDEVAVFDLALGSVAYRININAYQGFVRDFSGLYFSNMDDRGNLYRYEFSKSRIFQISDARGFDIVAFCDSDYVFVHRMNRDALERISYEKLP
jgi:hypothetical protein